MFPKVPQSKPRLVHLGTRDMRTLKAPAAVSYMLPVSYMLLSYMLLSYMVLPVCCEACAENPDP